MYRAYLFDLDGTIYVGDTLLSGAAETIAVLRKADWRTIFLSINPTKTRSQYATKLTRMGIPCVGYLGHLFRNGLSENNYPNSLEQLLTDSRNKYGSGNDFILPVIPVQGFKQRFWEQFKFKLNSSIRA